LLFSNTDSNRIKYICVFYFHFSVFLDVLFRTFDVILQWCQNMCHVRIQFLWIFSSLALTVMLFVFFVTLISKSPVRGILYRSDWNITLHNSITPPIINEIPVKKIYHIRSYVAASINRTSPSKRKSYRTSQHQTKNMKKCIYSSS
jgi:hypothetical protein